MYAPDENGSLSLHKITRPIGKGVCLQPRSLFFRGPVYEWSCGGCEKKELGRWPPWAVLDQVSLC